MREIRVRMSEETSKTLIEETGKEDLEHAVTWALYHHVIEAEHDNFLSVMEDDHVVILTKAQCLDLKDGDYNDVEAVIEDIVSQCKEE